MRYPEIGSMTLSSQSTRKANSHLAPIPEPSPPPRGRGQGEGGEWLRDTHLVVSELSSRTQLLISVRNAEEAQICLDSKVDWIDLKEPSAGPLGRPTWQVAQQVHRILCEHPRRSVALGELTGLDLSVTKMLGGLFPIAKVGLFGASQNRLWTEQLTALSDELADQSCQLVPVIYADWQTCSAPEPQAVLTWAIRNKAPYLLIDTYDKSGRRLKDYLTVAQLLEIVERGRDHGIGIVLAGSLQAQDLPSLLILGALAIAVRGAVCEQSRQGHLSAPMVQQWVRLLQ